MPITDAPMPSADSTVDAHLEELARCGSSRAMCDLEARPPIASRPLHSALVTRATDRSRASHDHSGRTTSERQQGLACAASGLHREEERRPTDAVGDQRQRVDGD